MNLQAFALFLLQYVMIDALRNIVIINNKPMTYDSRGELVELSIFSGEPEREEIYEKSNIFKKSDFVTKSKFSQNGILTKHNFTRKENPPKYSKFNFDITNDFPNYSVINSLFNKDPSYIQAAVVFDDVTNPSIDTNVNSTYDIFRPEKFETTKQRPTVAFYSTTTPAPTSIIPIIVTQASTNNKKINKKTKTKKTPSNLVASDIHDHIMKNLDYYKKLLSVNCTANKGQNEIKNEDEEIIEITPRPIKINDKDIQSTEKDKSKNKCDCKHHHQHGHHHKHSHEKYSHEKYKPSVVVHSPTPIQPVYVQSHKLPEYQTHFHHHQSSKGNNGLGLADNAALFESTAIPLTNEYNKVGSLIDNFYGTLKGILSENTNKDVDYESRDESGSDYSESIEEEEEEIDVSENESDYEEEDDDRRRRRRKREIFTASPSSFQKFPEKKLNILRQIFSLFKAFLTSLFISKSEKFESNYQSHNFLHKHFEGQMSGKVELLNKRLKREITLPQLPSNLTHDVITSSRSIPGDFMEMISHMMFSTKRNSPIKLLPSGLIKKKYHNYQLWRIHSKKKSEISYLNELRMSKEGNKLHWLESPRLYSFTDIVIAPELLESFKSFLAKGNIDYSVKLRNIQNAIRFENLRMNRKQQVETEIINGHPLTFYRYHPSKDIIAYYDYIKRKYPSFVELTTLGFTFNSKPLVTVKVSAPKRNASSSTQKPGVFILAGLSGHLWLPVASSLYILDNIVTNIANNDSLGEYIRKYDWYVLSLLNVDGYDYSMAFDRLWRKTRSEYINDDSSSGGLMPSPFAWFKSPLQNESNCLGVDATRNFDIKWKRGEYTAGDDKCSDFFEGPFPKSEPEVKLLSNFLQKNNKHIKLFVNLDGYGPLISFPTSNLKRKALDDIQEIAKAGLRNLKTHRSGRKKYLIKKDTLSTSPEGFAMHKAKIKYSYRIDSMENPQTSFFVPATSIQYNANDIFDIIKGMTKKMEFK